MAAWVREHGARESNVFEGIEIVKEHAAELGQSALMAVNE